MEEPRSKLWYSLMGVAAFVIVVAGMRAAAPILTLLLMAVFIAIITTPAFFGLQRWGIPSGLALAVLILALGVILTFGTRVLLGSLNDFSRSLPDYQERLAGQMSILVEWAQNHGMKEPGEVLDEIITGRNALKIMRQSVSVATGLLSRAFVILLITMFLLFEAAVLPSKIKAAPGLTDETRDRLRQAVGSVRQYMGMKTSMSILTGLLVSLMLTLFGIDYAILLGVTAFLFNYVPNIGSFVAALPGVMLAVVEYGFGRAAVVAVLYVVINVLVSNFIEPKFMGRGLGLSPVIIILSLIFWGWVLGPVGMLLSVPMTMTVKVFMDSYQETRGVAVLMGPAVPNAENGDD